MARKGDGVGEVGQIAHVVKGVHAEPCGQGVRTEVDEEAVATESNQWPCLLYTSPSPRDGLLSRMPSSA